ncbi:MAG TPA: glycine cleavage system protein GcvH [Clostridia bacterium]|nr:glycine cleavage system protein GcvH [Clostridia bacterium]
MTPADRKYTKEHEWILFLGEDAQLGITAHAQEALGDIVYVELPAVGETFEVGDSFAVVESVKAVSNVYTAVGGEVISVNEALDEKPELLNEDPYANHIAVFRISEIDDAALLSAEEYDAFILEENK